MKIIHNDSYSNHQKKILKHLKNSDEILIISPFLASDLGTLINYELLNKLKKITLVTTLKPETSDQIKKVSALFSLIKNSNHRSNLSIYIDNLLHAKVYLFKQNKKYISGIISSANFTLPGLTSNHETGIEIFEKKDLKDLEAFLLNQKGIYKFDIKQIDNMKADVDSFLSKNKAPKEEKIKLDLSKYLNKSIESETNNYWLKPIGETGHPVSKKKIFNKEKEKLHFSKTRPTGVKINDILIAYGVGVHNILSIYKVVSLPLYVTKKEIRKDPGIKRWPWYVIAKNLTTVYGTYWNNYDVKLKTLTEEFKRVDLTGVLTHRGGLTLGALNYHADKINLRKEFAEYIIGRVFQYN